MKNINQFIFEKLKLNRQSQLKENSNYIVIVFCHMNASIIKYLKLYFRSFLKSNHFFVENKTGETCVVFQNDINNVTEIMNKIMNNLSAINIKYAKDYSLFKLPQKYVNKIDQFVNDYENDKIDPWVDFEKFVI